MNAPDVRAAVAAALSTASAVGLTAEDALVLSSSNRLALRLRPCDALARVAPVQRRSGAQLEVDVVRRLTETGSPVASLDPRVEPRVYTRDGFAITLWSYHEPASRDAVPPTEYAQALERLHTGFRQVDLAVPHFTDRVAEAQSLVDDLARSPDLEEADRRLLSKTLQSFASAICERHAAEQLLHGEPHPGNLLDTKQGLLFTDFETCCRGPVEFDVAHVPEDVSARYPGLDQDLLRDCRILMLAMVASWRWDRHDHLPNGSQMGKQFLRELREALAS